MKESKAVSLVVKSVTKELLYQGYVASRLTGLTPANVKRAIKSALFSKYYIAFIFAAFLVGITLQMRFSSVRNQILFPVGVFAWFIVPVYINMMQISYGASAGPQIRELLLMLPLKEKDIESIAAKSILSVLRLPLIVSFAVLLSTFALLGIWVGIAGILDAVLSFSAAMSVVSLTFTLFRKLGSGSLSSISRGIVALPIALMALLYGYIQSINLTLNQTEKLFVPVLNLAGVMEGNIVSLGFASSYSILALAGSYFAFRHVSLSILSPVEYSSNKIGSFKVRLRRPELALIFSDFRVVLRSPRLSGLLLVPVVYALSAVFAGFVQGRSTVDPVGSKIFLVANAFPVGLISSFFPYVLYLAEFKGFSYMYLLPLGKFTNLKSKLYVSLGFYGISAAILGAGFYISSGNPQYLIPLACLSLPVLSCVFYTSLHFSKSVRNLVMGTIGLTNQIVYSMINAILFGIPASVYFVGIFLTNSLVAPVPYVILISIVETIITGYLVMKSSF
jgi:predicted permease